MKFVVAVLALLGLLGMASVAKADCRSQSDTNTWLTSGICVNSEDHMFDCTARVVILIEEVRPERAVECLRDRHGWALSDPCMNCFGELLSCTIEACLTECINDLSAESGCRECVSLNCNTDGAVEFDFPNCTKNSNINPDELGACTEPPNTIIPGLPDEAFFAIVGAGGLLSIVGGVGIFKYGCKDSDDISMFDDNEIRQAALVTPGSSYPGGSNRTGSGYTKPPPPKTTSGGNSNVPQLFGSGRTLNTGPAKIIVGGVVYEEEQSQAYFDDDDIDDDVF